MNNLITENYIENEFLGIFLVINNNNFNSISFNEFCKTSQDISIPKNSYNYVFDNTKYLTSFGKNVLAALAPIIMYNLLSIYSSSFFIHFS